MNTQLKLEAEIFKARRTAWLLIHGLTENVGIRIARRQDGTTYAELTDKPRVYADETVEWLPFEGYGEGIA